LGQGLHVSSVAALHQQQRQHSSSTNLTLLCSLHIYAFCFLQQKRAASLRTRTVSTVAMIAGFLGVIYAGHVPLVFLVLGLQV
jgi:hypothetical protein